MTKFVVRSMSTTDSIRGSRPIAYHVYLLPSHERVRAYWSSKDRAQLFDSVEEARAEIERSIPKSPYYGPEIVPADDRQVPTYWENQKALRN